MLNGNDNGEKELKFSRTLNGPINLVWEIWTNPEHIKMWWGPNGFTNTIHKMDVKPEGEWLLTMHGPDGTDYEIKGVFREIVKHKKIVYEQLTQFKYVATIEFESRKDKTIINWSLLFESKEKLLEAAKTYGVVDGFTQNAERMIAYLKQSNKN
jgi:uncharacterized protein YndB with AHSA1/START domain